MTGRWTVERLIGVSTDRFGVVLALLLVTYVLSSALPAQGVSAVVITGVQGVTVVAALAASGVGARARRAAFVAAVLMVGIAVLLALLGGQVGGGVAAISAGLLVVSLAAIIRRLVGHQLVSSQTLLGSMCCYVLFGLVYTFVYIAVAKIQGSPFLAPADQHSGSDYLFFSFTTLTTTGYGDLVPITGLGRSLSMLEALTGQLYLVTVVARLVALWIPQSRRRRDAEP